MRTINVWQFLGKNRFLYTVKYINKAIPSIFVLAATPLEASRGTLREIEVRFVDLTLLKQFN